MVHELASSGCLPPYARDTERHGVGTTYPAKEEIRFCVDQSATALLSALQTKQSTTRIGIANKLACSIAEDLKIPVRKWLARM